MAHVSTLGRQHLWTQVHISIVFLFIFTAYKALENIQSSLNYDQGLGTISLSVLYIGYVLSCLFIGTPLVYLLSPKWALLGAFLAHTAFIIVNIWPMWATLIPVSFVLGLAAGPLWISQGVYTTVLTIHYSSATGEDLQHVVSKFSGIFHMIYGISGPVGNLIASIIFTQDVPQHKDVLVVNGSFTQSNGSYKYGYNSTFSTDNGNARDPDVCGANHCPNLEDHLSVLVKPDRVLVLILMGVFLGFNIIGLICTLFLRNVPTTERNGICRKLLSTFYVMRDVNLLLLIFPFIGLGMTSATFYGSFAQSFISCPFGIGMLGYCMLCEGIGFILASFVCGLLSRFIPRVFLISLAVIAYTLISCTWLVWVPQSDQVWVVLVMSSICGVLHGTLRTNIAALVSLLFHDNPEASFAHYNLWMAIAYSASFAYTSFLCFEVKAYILIGVLILTAASCLALELRIATKVKRDNSNKRNSNKTKLEKDLRPVIQEKGHEAEVIYLMNKTRYPNR